MYVQSNTMSQAEFIRAILERDARNIYRAQQLIVSQRIYLSGKELKASRAKKGIGKRSGNLERSLANPDFLMKSQGETFLLAAKYPLYIRFLDMKHLGNRRIYNRQVWGILYNNALPEIKNKFGQFIRDTVAEALHAAFEKYSKR